MAKTVKKAGEQSKAAATPRKSPTRKKSTTAKVTEMPMNQDQVAMLAHQFWLERGQQHGHHEEDWLRAEQTLFGKAS
jgi:hypothetical protein